MLMKIYGNAFKVLMKKPLKLWGISLLATVLSPLLIFLCGAAIPGLSLAVSLLLGTAMTMIYLHGYRGEEVRVVQMFDCFKDFQTMKRVVLGLLWMSLWIFLWGLIPIAGPIFALVRAYEYRLTVYILITEPDINLTDAIKVSSQRTKGYKLQMWLADFVHVILFIVATLLLGLLAAIPYLGILFGIVLFVLIIAYAALAPLFVGLVQAAFYEEITNNTISCSKCGKTLAKGAAFCSYCGEQINN